MTEMYLRLLEFRVCYEDQMHVDERAFKLRPVK